MAITRRNGRYGVRVYRYGRHEWVGTRDTFAEARELERQEQAKVTTSHRETAGSFALRWVCEYPRPKASTRKLYAQLAASFARSPLGNVDLNRIDRPMARAYVLEHRHLHSMLSAMFNDALNDGLVAVNPFARLGLRQSRGRRDIKVLTEEEVARVADCALEVHGTYGPTFRALILFAAYTGVRNGEAFALEWRDIDWQKQEVTIARRAYEGEIDLPKSGKPRTIILPPAAAGALRTIPRAPAQRLVFTTKNGLLFGKNRCVEYWGEVWQRFAATLEPDREAELTEARGKPRMDFYELRHFCATMLLERGAALQDVAQQLGHADTKLIEQRYGHPSKAAARERLHRAFERNVTPLKVADQGAAHG